MVALLQRVQVVHLVLVELLEDGAEQRFLDLGQGEAIEVVRVQFELHRIPDRPDLHRVLEVVSLDELQLATAEEAGAVGNGEPGRDLVTRAAFPGVLYPGAADDVLRHHLAALRAGGRHG
ncbi:MAG TPA: hypothetical protein DCP38_11475 [Acidobacteria bacterium]|nr:hypothetical protein [Acidobacteriota bacterium]HAK56082.1 hypothetical protein [Acidobacteriota bacterium]